MVEFSAGEVGYICGSIKDVADARVRVTLTTTAAYRAAVGRLSKEN